MPFDTTNGLSVPDDVPPALDALLGSVRGLVAFAVSIAMWAGFLHLAWSLFRIAAGYGEGM